jgi:hypothetical protein
VVEDGREVCDVREIFGRRGRAAQTPCVVADDGVVAGKVVEDGVPQPAVHSGAVKEDGGAAFAGTLGP